MIFEFQYAVFEINFNIVFNDVIPNTWLPSGRVLTNFFNYRPSHKTDKDYGLALIYLGLFCAYDIRYIMFYGKTYIYLLDNSFFVTVTHLKTYVVAWVEQA